jgi:hypothetical protein
MPSSRLVRLAMEGSLYFVNAVNSNPALNIAAGPPAYLVGFFLFGWLNKRHGDWTRYISSSVEEATEVRK